MSTSTTAWTWFAMDFSQGELLSENFAVRFKTEDQALLFKTKFQECQAALKSNEPVIPSSEVSTATSTSQTKAEEKQQEPAVHKNGGEELEEKEESEYYEGAEEEEDEDGDYEDVEESIMFEKRCTLSCLEADAWVLLGTGDLKVVYDDEMLCARIVVEDANGTLLCDNVIAIETKLEVGVR